MNRAALASQLLNNKLFVEITTQLEHDLFEAWRHETNEKQRDQLWAQAQGIAHITGQIEAVASGYMTEVSNE